MPEQDTNIEADWRTDVSSEQKDILKVADGESVEFVFLSEGKVNHHADYGTSIVFNVSKDETEMLWFVNNQNYDLLKQIKDFGSLVGLKAKVSRTGSKKSDTRYKIEKVESEPEAPEITPAS